MSRIEAVAFVRQSLIGSAVQTDVCVWAAIASVTAPSLITTEAPAWRWPRTGSSRTLSARGKAIWQRLTLKRLSETCWGHLEVLLLPAAVAVARGMRDKRLARDKGRCHPCGDHFTPGGTFNGLSLPRSSRFWRNYHTTHTFSATAFSTCDCQ